MKKTLIFAAIALASINTQAAQVHVCTDAQGNKSFQQRPCAEGAQGEVKTYRAQMVGTDMPSADLVKAANEREANEGLRKLEREIRASEQRIRAYQASMNNELAALIRKKGRANNNLAGAQWEESISSEMNAVTARWDSMIRTEQSTLDNLRAQRFNTVTK